MLHSIKKLIGDKGRQLIVPIVLMSLDAIGSLVMYLMEVNNMGIQTVWKKCIINFEIISAYFTYQGVSK